MWTCFGSWNYCKFFFNLRFFLFSLFPWITRSLPGLLFAPRSSYLAFIRFSPGLQSDPGTDWLAHCSHTWSTFYHFIYHLANKKNTCKLIISCQSLPSAPPSLPMSSRIMSDKISAVEQVAAVATGNTVKAIWINLQIPLVLRTHQINLCRCLEVGCISSWRMSRETSSCLLSASVGSWQW